MKYLIVAAKTGGHIFPAKAVSEQLIKTNNEIVLLGIGNEIEKNAYKDLNSKLYKLSIDGFRGQRIFKKFFVIYQIISCIIKVLKIIKKENVDVMIGFGGFICIPAGLAMFIKKLPIFIHEQNAVMGSANRFLSKIAKINFLAFPIKNINRSIISGNPVRRLFINNNFKEFDRTDNEIRIYVTGGSQGAQYLNEELPRVFKKLSCFIKIKHQCGKNNLNKVNNLYKKQGIDAETCEFYNDPSKQILWSDFVISRAGALTLSEIISLKRGSLMIPLPTSIDNHQLENAKSIQRMGMGILHEEGYGKEKLINSLQDLINNRLYIDWKNHNKNNHVNATNIIINKIESYFKNETF